MLISLIVCGKSQRSGDEKNDHANSLITGCDWYQFSWGWLHSEFVGRLRIKESFELGVDASVVVESKRHLNCLAYEYQNFMV